MKPIVTIFTPTYNRAHLLTRLYNSLIIQTNKSFEWLIVDDGSTDETKNLINQFLSENLISIKYYRQINGGKHTAINKGVKLAKGDLFFIVDSDDYLPENSIEKIIFYYGKIKNISSIASITGKRYITNDLEKNIEFHKKEFESNFFDIRYKYNYNGDMAEVVKTSVMKEFPFPVFNDEKFCTEAVVWNRISKKYNCLFIDEFIYNCEYQEGGLTSVYSKLLLNNPNSSLLYYRELLKFPLNNEQRKIVARLYNGIAKIKGYSKFKVLSKIGIINFVKIYL